MRRDSVAWAASQDQFQSVTARLAHAARLRVRMFMERAPLNFFQKTQLARAISMDQSASSMWDLIDKLNAVRNKLAHSLDGGLRAKAMSALSSGGSRKEGDVSADPDMAPQSYRPASG